MLQLGACLACVWRLSLTSALPCTERSLGRSSFAAAFAVCSILGDLAAVLVGSMGTLHVRAHVLCRTCSTELSVIPNQERLKLR